MRPPQAAGPSRNNSLAIMPGILECVDDDLGSPLPGKEIYSARPSKAGLSTVMDSPLIDSGSDQRDMYRMGRKVELRRNFSLFSCIGFSIVLGCSWEFALVTGTYTLANGGIAGTVWMFVATCFGMFTVMLSMAEMASMTPSSGAQYHWVSEFAPARCQKFLSFTVGWLAVLGWESCMTLVGYVGGQQFQSLIAIIHPEYQPAGWHGTLFTMAVTTFSVFCNIFAVRKLPLLEGLMFIVHVGGFFFIVVILWVMGPRSDAHTVFTEFDNQSGWPSLGIATLVGITPPVVSLIGADSSCHLSEEMKNASRDVPKAMILTAMANYIAGLTMVISFMFNIGDIKDVLDSFTGQSYVAVIAEATGSKAATIFCTALVAFMMCACGINQATTSSRNLYAFARDNGMPYSEWISYVRPGWDFPLNAVIATLFYAFLTSLVIIASPNAFTIITSLSLNGLILSYLVAIVVIFWRKLKPEPMPKGKFSLGRRFGLCINGIAILFLTFVFAFSFWPTIPNPTAETMNWSLLVMGCCVIGCSIYYWLSARHHYTAPVERTRKHD
ncbi:GABA-specific permease [Elsinoe australis]|uniref:GABA-specific permease n=1 Tax=Elsinoe australis TaxID=40998 RepID=A0A2P7YEV1_9PEZI|nr:GABA-specific permease [Elsinoe australis]